MRKSSSEHDVALVLTVLVIGMVLLDILMSGRL
jgi:hypothetical protein